MTGLNLVLEQTFNVTGKHVGERFTEFEMQYIATDEQEARLYKNTFSKAEINNMDAGSYEQIKVEGGE
jgi:translation elongation factor P/translation initiation factor 5A